MPRIGDELVIAGVKDPVVREALDKIRQDFAGDLFRRFHGDHFVFEVGAAVTSYRLPHSLGFLPTDIVQTWLTPGVTWTWHYDLFDRQALYVTTSAAATVRALVGAFVEER